MKIFIPSYNRADNIKTHLLFKNTNYDYYIVLHNKDQYNQYIKNKTIDKSRLIISNQPLGISNQRNYILNELVKKDEWFIMMDDNINYFTAVDKSLYNKDRLDVKNDKSLKPLYNKKITINYLFKLIDQDIEKMKKEKIYYAGFAVVPNFYFREKKYRYVGYVISKAAIYKKTDILFNKNISVMDDYYYTAENLKRFGKVLINNYIFPIAGHYEKGGIGKYNDRVKYKIEDCKYLINKYPGLFRYKKKNSCDPKAELQVNFTNIDQVDIWKNKMNNIIPNNYTSPRWSGEILNCSMPMTFDTYNKCSYNCLYCFSFYQKSLCFGNDENRFKYQGNDLTSINIDKIKDLFNLSEKTSKANKSFFWYIKNKHVFQWGGLADAFDEYEKRNGVTLELLKFFKKINYPICFSTKGVWWLNDKRYTDLFKNQKNWNMKFSIINLNPDISKKIELGCPSPQDRLKAIKQYSKLNAGGVTLRLRPFIIGMTDKNDEYLDLIKESHNNGATAVSTEFFCLERRASQHTKERYNKMSEAIGFDIYKYYSRHSIGSGYSRLNRIVKELYIKKMYELCQKIGMRFYVSDAHFKEYSLNGSCCGLSNKWNYSRGQFTEALLIAKKNGKVHFSDISTYLKNYKSMSIAKLKSIGLHTTSAIENAIRNNQSFYDYFREMWNSPNKLKSPYKYFGGILKPIGLDKNKDVIYEYRGEKIK